jgi:TRAP-type uncharacterized transport system substrate-binding protein
MHQNKKDLAASFPALNQFAPDRMAKNMPGVTVHPGAIKLYQETGQWPPK